MSSEISITIRIANRNYRMKVDSKKESYVRDLVLKINERLNHFHKLFPGRDEQDYMAMTLIDFITSQESEIVADTNDKEIIEKLNKINTLLDL